MAERSRRSFCAAAAAFVAGMSVDRRAGAEVPMPVRVAVDSTRTIASLPHDFMGLSYETQQLAFPEFFSSRNTSLVQYFRTLSSSGVLRMGGSSSAFGEWSETPEAQSATPVDPSDENTRPQKFQITPESIRNLQSFLAATGWRCIYGLNLAGGDVENALAEATFVSKTLGPQLVCVQFGNEPDLFGRDDHKLWTYEQYDAMWTAFRVAFRKSLPQIAVAGPDTSDNLEWMKQFSETHAKDIALLTSHYYAGGPPSDPTMTPKSLLRPGKRFDDDCRKFAVVAQSAGIPYRISECNSCYGGGKTGVSDVFASSLWVADFCLSAAAVGCIGVNLHGGGNGRYSPIVGDVATGYHARPEFYGLLLAQNFAGRRLLATSVISHGRNLTAYAAGSPGKPDLVAILNKEGSDVDVIVSGLRNTTRVTIMRLRGPDLTSRSDITLGNSQVESSGVFQSNSAESLPINANRTTLRLRAYSASLLHLI